MIAKPFMAELHDIGKLVDRQTLSKEDVRIRGHTFRNFDFSQIGISQPSSPSWYAQFTDEVKSLRSTKIPKDYLPDVLLTWIADVLASAITRIWTGSKEFKEKKEKGGFVVEGIHVLWNPGFYRKEKSKGKRWTAFSTSSELEEMFEFIDSCENPNEFFEKFKDNLILTPEDKSVPFNIVTLFTHLELTGKIYRVLKKHSQVVEKDGGLYLKYINDYVQGRLECAGGRINNSTQRGKWIFRLLFCDVRFPQFLSRLRDLNVFRKRSDLIRNFSEDENTRDYVLFFTDNFMCLFIPREDEVKIKELLGSFLEAGFIIDCREIESELSLLTSSMERRYQQFHSLSKTTRFLKLYEKRIEPESASEISPPICDSCQMRHGKERIKEQIREYLCDVCYEIREMGEPAREYAEWEGKAAWMKITLDQDHLLKTIHKLFEEYVDGSTVMTKVKRSDKDKLKESFKPLAVQVDFVKDYKIFLKIFKERVYEIKDEDGNELFSKENFLYPIDDYEEFGIFRANYSEVVIKVLDMFVGLIEEYFPKCIDNSPIKLSISIAHVKYPYQEHWRFMSSPKDTINIQSPATSLTISANQYKALRERIKKENESLSYFLHRITDIQIKTNSDAIVMLEILNNRRRFPTILELLEVNLTPLEILNFYKLACGEDVHYVR